MSRDQDAKQETAGGASRRAVALLFAIVFMAHALVTGGHLQSPDEELMFRMAESMALRRSTSVAPIEYDLRTGRLLVPPHATFATRPGADGRFFAQYLPLQPALSVPLIALAHATEGLFAEPLARVMWPTMANEYHLRTPAEYYHRAVVVMFFNPLVAALTAVVLLRVGTMLSGRAAGGWIAACAWAFATIGWAHSKTYFTEPLAGLLGLLATGRLVRWSRGESGAGMCHAVWMGIWLALANWTRVDSPFITAGLVLTMAWLGLGKFRRGEYAPRPLVAQILVAGAIPVAAFLALQLFNSARFGGVDVTAGYGDQSEAVKFSTPLLVGLHGLLMSPGKGMLFFSPAVVLAIWGWLRAGSSNRDAVLAVLAGWAPFFLAMAMWQNWDGGWCWGPRHVVQVHAPLMLGAAFLATTALDSVRRVAIACVMAVGGAVQVYGTSQSAIDYYSVMYNSFDRGLYHPVNYRGLQEQRILEFFDIRVRETGLPVASINQLPAPMLNSLYVPQDTQWQGYRRMWRAGWCDWFWLRAVDRRESPDVWGQGGAP